MPSFPIAVVKQAAVPDDEIVAFCTAFGFLLPRFAERWPEVAGSRIFYSAAPLAAGEVPLVLAPNTTLANSLGYHTVDAGGRPCGIVELDACQKYGQPWTIAACHEAFEMLINPTAAKFIKVGANWYPHEVCDPVTGDQIMVGAVAMANAVTPEWFDPNAKGAVLDLLGKVEQPIPAIPPNGWLEWYDGQSYRSAYGPEMDPAMIAYMRERQGRRAHIRAA